MEALSLVSYVHVLTRTAPFGAESEGREAHAKITSSHRAGASQSLPTQLQRREISGCVNLAHASRQEDKFESCPSAWTLVRDSLRSHLAGSGRREAVEGLPPVQGFCISLVSALPGPAAHVPLEVQAPAPWTLPPSISVPINLQLCPLLPAALGQWLLPTASTACTPSVQHASGQRSAGLWTPLDLVIFACTY